MQSMNYLAVCLSVRNWKGPSLKEQALFVSVSFVSFISSFMLPLSDVSVMPFLLSLLLLLLLRAVVLLIVFVCAASVSAMVPVR